MKFEVGKVYKHSSGKIMAIVGMADTTGYGKCLVGEESNKADLTPVGVDEDATQGWEEIEREEWDKLWED